MLCRHYARAAGVTVLSRVRTILAGCTDLFRIDPPRGTGER
jgi:hypothetical protein